MQGTTVQALVQSKHAVIMVTGDAALTALHVANEVGICDKSARRALVLSIIPAAQGIAAPATLQWSPAVGSGPRYADGTERRGEKFDVSDPGLGSLSERCVVDPPQLPENCRLAPGQRQR